MVGPWERISIPYAVGGVKRHPVNARTLPKVGHLYRDGYTLCQVQNAMVPDERANYPAGEISHGEGGAGCRGAGAGGRPGRSSTTGPVPTFRTAVS